jgi:hypothetical protein
MDTLWYISERVYVWYMYGLCVGSNYVTYATVVLGMAVGMTLPLHAGFQHMCEYMERERRQRYELTFTLVVLSVTIAGIVYFDLVRLLFPFEFFSSCEQFDPSPPTDKQWKV